MCQGNSLRRRARAGCEHHDSDIVTLDDRKTLLAIYVRFWGSLVPVCDAHRRSTAGTFDAHDPTGSTAGLPILQLPCMVLRRERCLSGKRRDPRAQLIRCERRVKRRDAASRNYTCEKSHYEVDA